MQFHTDILDKNSDKQTTFFFLSSKSISLLPKSFGKQNSRQTNILIITIDLYICYDNLSSWMANLNGFSY
jgi:hypothetical protein